jgi:hypothetical protein
MSNTSSTPVSQSGLSAADDTRILQRMLTGHVVAKPAFAATYAATVQTATDSTAVVTIDIGGTGFTFTCNYETRVTWPGIPSPPTPVIPPAGTQCVVVFPENDPEGYGWIVAFICWYG